MKMAYTDLLQDFENKQCKINTCNLKSQHLSFTSAFQHNSTILGKPLSTLNKAERENDLYLMIYLHFFTQRMRSVENREGDFFLKVGMG